MGFCPDPTQEMGEYSVEVRKESFYLRGENSFEANARHAIFLYRSNPVRNNNQGTCEILLEDIPKIRAALDQVERIQQGKEQ